MYIPSTDLFIEDQTDICKCLTDIPVCTSETYCKLNMGKRELFTSCKIYHTPLLSNIVPFLRLHSLWKELCYPPCFLYQNQRSILEFSFSHPCIRIRQRFLPASPSNFMTYLTAPQLYF